MKKIYIIFSLFLCLSSCSFKSDDRGSLRRNKEKNVIAKKYDSRDKIIQDLGEEYTVKGSSDIQEIDDIYKKMLTLKTKLPDKKLRKIAILAPLSGEYSGIGNAILDGAKMAMLDSGGSDVVMIPMDTNSLGIRSVSEKIKEENVDVVLGPLFSKDTTNLVSNFSRISAPIITFSNDKTLTKLSNVEVFGFSSMDKVNTALKFIKEFGRMNVALLLKSDAGSQIVYENVNNFIKKNKMTLMSSAFYGDSEERISASVSTINKNKAITYNIDKNGNPYLVSLSAVQKNKDLIKDTTKQLRKLDVILTDAGGNMLDSLLSEMSSVGLLNRDIVVVSLSDDVNIGVLNADVYYVSHNKARYDVFKELYKNTYNVYPTQFSSLGYDAMGAVMTLILKNDFSRNALHDEAGFVGVSGEFRFTNSRIVERKYSIYKISNMRIDKVL